MQKRRTTFLVVFVAALALILLASGPDDWFEWTRGILDPQIAIAQTGQNGDSDSMSNEELISTGEEVYNDICATCHQPDGQGSGGYPALAGSQFVTAPDPTGPIETVLHGRGAMPSFGDQLSNQQIAAVTSYVRNSWGNEASVVQPSQVSTVAEGGNAAQQTTDQQAQGQAETQDEEQQAPDQQATDQQTADQQDGQQPQEQADQAQAEIIIPELPEGGGAIQIEIQIIVVTPTPADQMAATQAMTQTQPGEATATPEATQAMTPTGEATTTPMATPTSQAAEAQTPAPTPTSQETGDQSVDAQAATDQAEDQAAETQPSATAGVASPIGSAVTPTGTLPGDPAIQLVKVAEGMVDPLNVAYAPDGSGRIFVVERIGRIRIIQDGQLLEEPFLDISSLMEIDFLEQGLLGVAFHPNYSENGRFFVYYTDNYTNGDSFLVEFSVSDEDPNVADPNSARVLLTHDQPYRNHNGGEVLFGPDGYLYWSMGDGGLAGDSLRNAQNLENLLGAILRINVDTDHWMGYTIPDDNPFLGHYIPSDQGNEEGQDGDYVPDARPEIWAYGLRNPWQFSFDRDTGDMYIADVGQAAWEEINFQPAGAEGGINYGWPHMEGSHCFLAVDECWPFGELPVAEYANPDMGCSITGIGIYRGDEFENLDGIYFSADYCSGRFFGLRRGDDGTWNFAPMLQSDLVVTGGGEDEAGNLYVTTCTCQFGDQYDPYTESNGTLWRIVDANAIPEGAETAPLRE